MAHRFPRTSASAGFSLVELMVALAIGLVLALGVTTLMANTHRTHSELSKSSRQIESGRSAMQLLSTEIQHAGFYGEFGGDAPLPGTLPDPCDTTPASLEAGLALPIQGFDGQAGGIPACVAAAGHVPGTDVLVLRRVETRRTDAADLQASEIYLQGAPNGWRLGPGDPTLFTLINHRGDGVPIYRYRTDIYFIGQANGGPALRRLELAGGRLLPVTLVDAIENLQLDYGIDRSGDGAPNASDGLDDAYVPLPASPGQWRDVVALRVHLLARNPEPTPGYVDQKRYRLGLAPDGQPLVVGPFGDAFRRHAYQSAARAVNISSRRE